MTTFSNADNVAVGRGPLSVAVGDFDGDGHADLVTANAFDANVSVLLGDGTGGFDPPVNFAAAGGPGSPGGPTSVVLGHFDGDGVLDLVTANRLNENVTVL